MRRHIGNASGHWAVELDPATVTSRYLTADQSFDNFDVSTDFGGQQVTPTDSLGEATTSTLTLAPRS